VDFAVKDLGHLSFFLGIEILHVPGGCLINGFGVEDLLFAFALCSQITILPSAHKQTIAHSPISFSAVASLIMVVP
jgi:hypothetical protein